MHKTLILLAAGLLAAGISFPALAGEGTQSTDPLIAGSPSPGAATGIDLIQHIVVIMQENRSFDHYFGTYRPPDPLQKVAGIPRKPSGAFAVCVPDPATHNKCMKPFHATTPRNIGGPHGWLDSVRDVNHGRMNGFIQSTLDASSPQMQRCTTDPTSANCKMHSGPQGQPDVMSYFVRSDIPNYYALADWGVLQDHMFEPVDSYSLPSHMYLTSAWAASCTSPTNPMSCRSDPQVKGSGPYPWTDLTYLMDHAKPNPVSWKYYVGDGTNLSCPKYPCPPKDPKTATPSIWNPVPGFVTVQRSHDLSRVQHTSNFFDDANNGTLPDVSFVIPGGSTSEHPQHGSLVPGYAYVSRAINALSQGPEWPSTAIFLSWDDWGGFYDHLKPPKVDSMGYGIRAPGLVISPYARTGVVDHQILSSDAYLKFIEDRFLGGQRINRTDGRPDSRPTVREAKPILGNLTNDFDFTQAPRTLPVLDPNNSGLH